MTLQQQIMREREKQGLKLTVQDSTGETFTLYPKDMQTKERWQEGYKAKGYSILS